MRQIILILSLIEVCTATSALAAAIVVGRGVGRECYEETLLDPTPIHNAIALDVCDRAVEDYTIDTKTRVASFVNRGDILLRMKRYREAVADSDMAIGLNPEMSVAHLNRGAGLIGLERYNEALTALNRAIDLGLDKSQLAYFNRAIAKEKLGDNLGAYYDYRKAVELDPTFQLAIEQLSRFTVKKR